MQEDVKREAKNRYEKWKLVRATLRDEDFDKIQGTLYINRTGWFKVASIFALSFEIKESQRIETTSNGKTKTIWRYKVRVSGPDGYAEADGVASSEEFKEEKSESFISYLAQIRAYTRAISFLVGSGELSSEEMNLASAGMAGGGQSKGITQETKSEGKHAEREKIQETEPQVKTNHEEEQESDEQTSVQDTEKLTSIKRSEILNQIRDLMSSIGLKTTEEKRKYASEVLGKEVGRGISLSDSELAILLKRLKSDAAKKKLS